MFRELDTVILIHEIEEYSLEKGAVGTIVDIPGKDAYDVEFIDSSTGRTIALLTLTSHDIYKDIDNPEVVYFTYGTSYSSPLSMLGESYDVGTAKVLIKTESNRARSKTKLFNFQGI